MRGLQQQVVVLGVHEEITQIAALRREQGCPHRLPWDGAAYVVGDQAIEEADAIGAGEGNNAAMRQVREVGHGMKMGAWRGGRKPC